MTAPKRMDAVGRIVIFIMLKKGMLSTTEKAKSVKALLEDGLTINDIHELYPGLDNAE